MELLSPKEVREELKIGRSTLRNYVEEGILKKYWIAGKTPRFDKKEVLKLLSQEKK